MKTLLKAISELLIGLCLVAVSFSASAQSSDCSELVNIDIVDGTVYDVVVEVEKQTQFLFFYQENDVNPQQKISIKAQNEKLSSVLDKVCATAGLKWELVNKHITLSKKNSDGTRVISGTVKDNLGQAIIGAAIVVKGTSKGESTDIDGNFRLEIGPNDGKLLEVVCLGYKTKTITLNSASKYDIILEDDSFVMEATVVTALGIKRSEKALSYNVQEVKPEDMLTNKDANFINALNGKVAGLNINASSSGVGGASKVIMRGQKSISQSSNALYVIDGVPMYTTAREGGTQFDSQGSTDPMADINPEDIESISVLTGAAAAALYGSDAANGAIVVTTKKGKEGKLVVNASAGVEVMSPFILPRFQNRYGTGDLNSSIGSDVRSYGKLMNVANNPGYNPAKDYFQTGVINTESFSVSTGSEKNQAYFSASAIDSKGIVPNNGYHRYNFTFRNTTSFLKDKMHLDIGASYVIQKDRNMTNQGTYNNPLVGAYIFPRSGDWDAVKMYERYNVTRRISTQYWPVGDAGMTMQNPYWINYRNLRENRKDRYMLNASLNYEILDWLNVAGRVRVDNSNTNYTEKFYATTLPQLTESSSNGLYGISAMKDSQIYADALININKRWENWSVQANIGASITDMRFDAFKNRGPIADGEITDEKPGLANVFNVQNLSNSTKTTRLQEGWREQTQSIFGSAELGYKGAYYLTLTARNDWPSQLAGPHSNKKSFFYPSVGASVVLSQIIPNMPENLEYLKVRASYASVGTAFERYIANPMYKWNSSGLSWNTQTQYPMYDLKPELTNSWEVGLSMRFLKYFSLEATYYHTNTLNQTFNPQISTGSGSSEIYIQSGDVMNQGCEITLGFSKDWHQIFNWNSNFTFSTNQNRIESLAENVLNAATGEYFSVDQLDMNGLGMAHFILREGGTLGDLYSLADYKYDGNGKIVVSEDGTITPNIIADAKDYVKLGSVLPTANLAWRNDFRIKDFSFGFLVTARLGGVVYSSTQAVLDYYGVSEASAAARDAGGVMINGGDMIDANKWFSSVGGSNPLPQEYTYSGTNVRLQEASIGYTIPRKVMKDVCEMSFALVGRNLWMIYNKAPFDPESVATTGNYYQGIDHFMMPSLRNFGFNVRLTF